MIDTIKNAYKCLYAVRYGTNWRGDYQDVDGYVMLPSYTSIMGGKKARYGDCEMVIGWKAETEHVVCCLSVDSDGSYWTEIYTGWNDTDKWNTAIAEVWLKFCDSHASELI